VNQWGNGSEVPIFERLFLGGSNNLRGFPYREVGPQQNGEPIGGQSMARATVEWTFPIIEKARGAVFYDTGFVNSSAWSFGFNNIASDVGVGLRLDLPIGPLRLDYGYPVMRDGYHGGGHFNFNVGYQF
jgi:outer membrane protein insertion porin family